MRRRRWVWGTLATLVIIIAPIAWYLGSPLFISRRVDEAFPTGAGSSSFPMSERATVPEGMTRQQVEETMMKASEVDQSAAEAMPGDAAAAAILASGSFVDADSFHRGEGTATVYRVGQQVILRLENFKVTNGPALHVILTKHPAPRTRAEVQEGYVEVAKLKGNIGSQNYMLPANFGDFRAVVIYCKPFHVVFSTATIEQKG